MTPDVSLLLAGDALITRVWSEVGDVAFLGLIDAIRAANVSVANLETVIHEFKGHAQANAGGVYLASPPQIAAELKWAGFDMLAHANNHAFDYGAVGVLETIQHVEGQGLIIAGSGRDLQQARAPRYVHCKGSTVALVAMASDFVQYGRASYSRPEVPGRPGVNPLATRRQQRLMRLGLGADLGNLVFAILRRACRKFKFPQTGGGNHLRQTCGAFRSCRQSRRHFRSSIQRRHCRLPRSMPTCKGHGLRRSPGKPSIGAPMWCWFMAPTKFAV